VGGTIATCALLESKEKANWLSVAVTWGTVGHGFCWIYCTNLFSNVTSWRHEARGYVVGSMQAFFGMSGSIMISIYSSDVFEETRLVEFLIFAVVVTLGLTVLARCLALADVQSLGRLDALSLKRFRAVAIYVVILLSFVVITSLADQTSWSAYAIIASLICLGPVLCYVFPYEQQRPKENDDDDDHQFILLDDGEPLLPATTKSSLTRSKRSEPSLDSAVTSPSSVDSSDVDDRSFSDEGDAASTVVVDTPPAKKKKIPTLLSGALSPSPPPPPPLTTTKVIPAPPPVPPPPKDQLACISSRHTVEFWTLFVAFGVVTGGAIATSNSMVAIARSLRTCQYAHLSTASLTLLTASDAFARMIGGVVINAEVCDGNVVLAAGALLIGASHTVFSAAHDVSGGPYSSTDSFLFLIASAMAGLANGAAWTSCPWLVSARFGTQRYGENFGIVTFAAIVGVMLYVKAVLPLGDAPTDDDTFHCHDHDDDTPACYGAHCFYVFHRSIQAAALVAFVLALDLERKRIFKHRPLQQRNNNNNDLERQLV